MLRVQRFQAFAGNVGVNLRCGNIRMTQQHLHDSEIGTVVEQMRGKGVTENMW